MYMADSEYDVEGFKKYAYKKYARIINPKETYTKYVFVVKGPYDPEYFDATTPQELDKSSLYVLKWLYEEDFVVCEQYEPEKPVVAREVFELMPFCSAKIAGIKDWTYYDEILDEIKENRRKSVLVEYILAERDAKCALVFLYDNFDYDSYPSVSLERLQVTNYE